MAQLDSSEDPKLAIPGRFAATQLRPLVHSQWGSWLMLDDMMTLAWCGVAWDMYLLVGA